MFRLEGLKLRATCLQMRVRVRSLKNSTTQQQAKADPIKADDGIAHLEDLSRSSNNQVEVREGFRGRS